MVDTVRARETMGQFLTGLEELEPGIFRGFKVHQQQPYATYYVDATGDVEARADTLGEFQDRLIGERYFNSSQELRWNSYLYFLAEREKFDGDGFRLARSKLEADRNYARKFVLPEEDLPGLLADRIDFRQSNVAWTSDPVTAWRSALVAAGLQEVLGDEDIAPLVRRFLDNAQLPESGDLLGMTMPPSSWERQFLRSFVIHCFRRFPQRRVFDFGAVNLIHGPNGAGKTSLLEAIEYLYCGANFRAKHVGAALLDGQFGDEETVLITSQSTPAGMLRDRNMRWYGNLDVKKSTLHEGFSTFNFLNTDAAVNLSREDDSSRLLEDLSALLVGPEAARVWGRIERAERELRTQRSSLQALFENQANAVQRARDRIAEARAVPRSSNELFALLRGYLEALAWRSIHETAEDAVDTIAMPLGTLVVDLETVFKRDGTSVLLRYDDIQSEIGRLRAKIERAEKYQLDFGELAQRRGIQKASLELNQAMATFLERYQLYLDSGYANLVSRRQQLLDEASKLAGGLDGLNVPLLLEMAKEYAEVPLATLVRLLDGEYKTLQHSVAAISTALHSRRDSAQQLNSLRQELRALAMTMFSAGASTQSCPLCATGFEGETLINRIGSTENDEDVEVGRLVTEASILQGQSAILTERLSAVEGLRKQSDTLNFGEQGPTLSQAIKSVTEERSRLDQLESEIETVRRAVEDLRSLQLSQHEHDQLRARIESFASQNSLSDFDQVRQLAQRILLDIRSDIADADSREKALRVEWEEIVSGELSADLEHVELVVRGLTERVAALEALQRITSRIIEHARVPPGMTTGELLVGLRAALNAQLKLVDALAGERHANNILTKGEDELAQAEGALETVSVRRQRLLDAVAAIENIRELSPLASFTSEALEANVMQIREIFHRIHAPSEFDVQLAPSGFLRRLDDSETVQLTQVSTGQRAAFALSIFLGMNLSAVAAPPVILIDDPVAHIDDMNTLSFLDYLREIAVSGSRQIFFATADDKLAALFAHKFSFLGAEFRVHELSRAAPTETS